MKGQCLLNSYMYVYFIYMYRYNICIYIYIYIKEYLHVHKITLNENKMPTPLIKHTFICWTRLKTEKLLATALQLIRKNYVSCLKNQTCFVHSLNVQISSTPSPCSFLFAFYWLLHLFPRQMDFWMAPHILKSLLTVIGLKRLVLLIVLSWYRHSVIDIHS